MTIQNIGGHDEDGCWIQPTDLEITNKLNEVIDELNDLRYLVYNIKGVGR